VDATNNTYRLLAQRFAWMRQWVRLFFQALGAGLSGILTQDQRASTPSLYLWKVQSAGEYRENTMSNVLLGVSGSVAAVKWAQLCHGLASGGASVRVIFTSAAQHFATDVCEKYDPVSWAQAQRHIAAGRVQLFNDIDEWKDYRSVHSDAVLHIELRKWADALVIAPLSANTLGKLANGLCDNLLTSVCRAWDFSKPMVLCPAMNTMMWEHPLTARQLDAVKSFRPDAVSVVVPVSKTLACGDSGTGALAAVPDIIASVLARLPRGEAGPPSAAPPAATGDATGSTEGVAFAPSR